MQTKSPSQEEVPVAVTRQNSGSFEKRIRYEKEAVPVEKFTGMALFYSDFDPAHCLRNCKDQNHDQADRCDPFQHYCIEFFLF